MLAKLWQLFGWYYLLLLLLLLVYFSFLAKIRKLLIWGVVLVTVLVNLWFFGRFVVQNQWRIGAFFQGSEKIMAKTSSGQSTFVKVLREKLPPGATGCVYWYNDTPTVYLISELYPRRFRAIEQGEATNNCNYIISPKR